MTYTCFLSSVTEDDLQDLSADFGLQLGQLNDTTTGGAVWYNFLESQHRGIPFDFDAIFAATASTLIPPMILDTM